MMSARVLLVNRVRTLHISLYGEKEFKRSVCMKNYNEQLKLAEKVISDLFENSTCEEPLYKKVDRLHSLHTRKWVMKIDPDASIELQIAALGHDIDRTDEKRRIRKDDYEDYDIYKRDHSMQSAKILGEALILNGIDEEIVEKVKQLVSNHEVGGDVQSEILKIADSLSFFDDNLYLYYKERGKEKAKLKVKFMYSRLPEHVKKEVRKLEFEDKEIQAIVKEVIEEDN